MRNYKKLKSENVVNIEVMDGVISFKSDTIQFNELTKQVSIEDLTKRIQKISKMIEMKQNEILDFQNYIDDLNELLIDSNKLTEEVTQEQDKPKTKKTKEI